ncbi:1-deoxy-D-xylulose-5-phosphate synthase [Isoptericola sp. b441]|uniref:1-deoxy-D-xylulose-5-phosphate synthase n=1 Tax=Actinotalea lenta TaxID=3064654 RepID=A0ABT9DBE4_9CELL|nr:MULTISPECIES: 1-deoxy-D-xylulose-5-phosphate synthase [unclassified Isoptericola]MDO8107905.1 1-deoxy-D-xylulose-5-phosphate synthase [Isoptericola sp. b441]MDO8120427.1 1-deoxy-D-xylulose-5-phosphate synthase [Isoptericola sp. b490]
MALLPGISSPADVRALRPAQLESLATEIRAFLVDSVSRTGGHLGPNLGVVELTIALHRVFESPRDTIVFDTGHQAYVHKLLTGRSDFSALRQRGGLSGYPSRAESEHDVVENSHASTGLSWADGIAKANELRGAADRHVAVVVGDGALTGGMAWEALNNIAAGQDRRLVIVVNDNQRSYAPTIGGLAAHLTTLRTTRSYENVLAWGKRTLRRSGPPGRLAYEALHGLKKGIKDVVAPQGMFEDLGLKYVGPVDGHDVRAVEGALARAKAFGGPVIVHVITEKGRGYTPAEQDVSDRFHAVGVIHPETGLPIAPSRFGWTSVFADEMVRLGHRRPDLVAITAAMLEPVGLAPFTSEFPSRVFDVGIAEQHAVASAAGLAFGGMHPVVAVYATFLNRAFDQVLMDVALHKAGVTFVLDRAGITGDDGASHNGQWDMSLLRLVPGLRLAAPRDEDTLRAALQAAVEVDDAPTVLRYPKGPLPPRLPAVDQLAELDVLGRHDGDERSVLVVGVGAMAHTATRVAELLAAEGCTATAVDPRWVLPVPESLVKAVGDHTCAVVIEDGVVEGGVGSMVAQHCAAAGVRTPVHPVGIPLRFLEHASRAQLVESLRLRAEDIAHDALRRLDTPAH